MIKNVTFLTKNVTETKIISENKVLYRSRKAIKWSTPTTWMDTVQTQCSELVDYAPSYLQTDKFGLHFGLVYDLW